ncbi:CBS domain-containing protein [Oceaniglobus ichthyenteri]|uniref:CBS domain-containing protein n=1 Tax=Oceaniglobus ichthyenteri TaxID=2136177 RepID=UPI000D391084|nr:CBS domain-containing protein [Oceaniglobus ichthyenteri]
MRVSRIMQRQPSCVGPGTSIRAAAALMKDRDIGFLPVVEGGVAIGVLTDRDLVLGLMPNARWGRDQPVSTIMTRYVSICHADHSVVDAARMMGDRRIRRLLVNDPDGRLLGIVSLGDIARDASEELAGQTLGEIVECR